jgi:4-hydroxy-tetrahydrodipicolinate synthase
MVQEQVAMIDAWREGRIDEARDLGKRVQRLADVVFDAPVANYRARLKESLKLLGVLEDASVRPPLRQLDDAERRRLADTLVEVGLLTGATA